MSFVSRAAPLLGGFLLALTPCAVFASPADTTPPERKWSIPPPAPQDATPRAGSAKLKPPPPNRDSSDAGRLKGMRAVSLTSGQATVEIGGVQQTVHPGEVLGTDIVRSIVPGRIVLERPAHDTYPGGTVVATFDAQGNACVRVYSLMKKPAAPSLAVPSK